MSRHIHIESGLTMTGSKADVRIPVKPSQQGIAALALYNEVARKAGAAMVQAGELPEAASRKISEAATSLWEAKGNRSEEHTSELQSLMRISYAVFCLKKKKKRK